MTSFNATFLRFLAAIGSRENAARMPPKSERYRRRIDVESIPPCSFIAVALKLAVMWATIGI